MEKIPHLGIVGNTTPEHKAELETTVSQRLFNHIDNLPEREIEILKKYELAKTPDQLAFIDLANQETNRLRRQFGLEAYDISADNYHLLPANCYREIGVQGRAVADCARQGVALDQDFFADKPLYLAATLFHETMHLKSNLVLQDLDDDWDFFKSGVSCYSNKLVGSDSGHIHFKGLHEAIVAVQENKELPRIMQSKAFDDYRQATDNPEHQLALADFVQRQGIDQDISFVYFDPINNRPDAIDSYPQHQRLLKYICAEISSANQSRYHDWNDVFSEFLEAQFTGRLLTVGRLVEQTFGEGSFRLLSNISTEANSALVHLDDLRQRRRKCLATIDHQ